MLFRSDIQESGVGAVFDDKKFLAYKMNFPALIPGEDAGYLRQDGKTPWSFTVA